MSDLVASEILTEAFIACELSVPSSFDDGTGAAAIAKVLFPAARRTLLSACDWSFASKVAVLPQLVTAPIHPKYAAAFQLPMDMLVMRELLTEHGQWEVAADAQLWTEEAGAVTVRYTADVTREAQFLPAFNRALALELAVRLATKYMPIANRLAALKDDRDAAMAMAMRDDASLASPRSWTGSDTSDWSTGAQI